MDCTFRPAAEEDLESIGDYIAEENPSRAVTFVQELREKYRRLAYSVSDRLKGGSQVVVAQVEAL